MAMGVCNLGQCSNAFMQEDRVKCIHLLHLLAAPSASAALLVTHWHRQTQLAPAGTGSSRGRAGGWR